MADDFKRIEESTVHSHPFKAHYHGTETGDPGYLAVESGHIVPVGFATGVESILPTLKGEPLQDQGHTGELTFIQNPPVGDYYMEATGEWRTTGMDGDNKIEMFEPHVAEILHHGDLTLTDDKKRALKVFRLESDGRITQYIKSDIPMAPARTVPHVVPPEPPEPGSDSDSSSSSSGSWYATSDSSSSAPYRWAKFVDQFYPPLLYPGVTSDVQVQMRNDGNIPWATTYRFLPLAYNWGVSSIPTPVTSPGVTRSLNFNITAPLTPGPYPFQWSMYDGMEYFGELTPEVIIEVVNPPTSDSSSSGPSTYQWATFREQNYIPIYIPTGSTANVQVKMRNDGNIPWESSYQLLPIAYDWGVSSIPVPFTSPGVTREFNFTITAPLTAGPKAFQWQMYDGMEYFGGQTPEVTIQVVYPPTPPTIPSSSSSSAGPPPLYDYALFVHQHVVPEEMYVNEETWVTVTFRNTGTTTWEPGMYKLLPMRHHWGNFEIALPTRTLPGAERTFDITMTAPGAPGTYWWQWQMYGPNGVFAQIGAEKAVIVSTKPVIPPVPVPSSGEPGSSSGTPPTTNAAFVNWFVIPEEMWVNETTWVQITMRNTGNTTWYPGYHKLIPQNDVWGVFEVALTNQVLPGAEYTFDVEFYAPATQGIYDFQWQMYNGATASYFGQMTPNEQIVVRTPPPPIIPPSSGSDSGSGDVPPVPPSGVSSNNATFVHQFPVPPSLPAGGSTDVQITFRNTGSTTWTSDRHSLVAATPYFNNFWGLSEKAVSSTAPPGVERVFYLHLTASSTGGNYPFRWQMYDSVAGTFFGELTPEVNIYVAPPAASTSSSS